MDRHRVGKRRRSRRVQESCWPLAAEIELLEARYRGEFTAAFREAMGGLSQRQRALLRFTFVERLTPARLGVVYGVHRTTAMRWVEAAQEEILSRTRTAMMDRLHLSASECDGLIALLKSRIDITLASLLEEPNAEAASPMRPR